MVIHAYLVLTVLICLLNKYCQAVSSCFRCWENDCTNPDNWELQLCNGTSEGGIDLVCWRHARTFVVCLKPPTLCILIIFTEAIEPVLQLNRAMFQLEFEKVNLILKPSCHFYGISSIQVSLKNFKVTNHVIMNNFFIL